MLSLIQSLRSFEEDCRGRPPLLIPRGTNRDSWPLRMHNRAAFVCIRYMPDVLHRT